MSDKDAYQDALNKLIGYLDQTVDFAKGQLPEVAKEMLVYGTTYHHFWMYFTGVFAVLFIIAFVCTVANDNEGGSVVSLVIALILCVCCGGNIMQLYKIEEAPKVYVLEELKSELPHN